MIRLLLLLLALLAASGCQREAAQPAVGPSTPVVQAAHAANPLQASGAARMDGYGDLRFGMTSGEVQHGARMALHRTKENGICYFMTPDPASGAVPVDFMVEADKLVRYDVANAQDSAPGGGKSGMSAEQIEQLYAGQARERPSTAGGRLLRVKGDAGVAIVFEIGTDGLVSRWRVGQVPQVDYGHGCS
jgi:hypothetical protein